MIGFVVHEDHAALVAKDHFAESGPLVSVLGHVFRLVDVREETCVCDCRDEVLDFGVDGVDDEDGDNVVGVVVEELSDGRESVFVWAGVEQVAVAVAVVECLVGCIPVDLS